MCWYDPPEESKQKLKRACQQVVDVIKEIEKDGDPLYGNVSDAVTLIRHLYDPHKCQEAKHKEQP